VDRVPDSLLLRKTGSAGNLTQTTESVVRKSENYTTEAVSIYIYIYVCLCVCMFIYISKNTLVTGRGGP
jgi:hypothetical protein